MTQNLSNLTPEDKARLLELLRAQEELGKDYLKNMKFSLIQEAYLCSTAKITVLVGANQTGKSTSGAVKILVCSGQGMPDSLKDKFPKELIKPGEYQCISLDFTSSVDVAQKKIFSLIPKHIEQQSRFNKELRKLFTPNKSEIAFKSEESGWQKMQGSVKRGNWVDEECKKQTWNELYMRTISLRGWMSLTFSPLLGLTWAHADLWQKAWKYTFTKNKHGIVEDIGVVHTLDEIQKLKDRELVVRHSTEPDADKRIEVFQMCAYDNPHLSNEEIQAAEIQYKDDPAAYNARILGTFSKLVGNCVFDRHALMKMQIKCPTTYERGEITNGVFKQTVDGRLLVFKKKKDVGKGYYVVAGDCSLGTENGNRSVIQVLDHLTCEQVAVWRGRVDPTTFAGILVSVAKYYNDAWLAPESNNHGIAVINKIKDLGYKKLFCDYEATQQVLKPETSVTKKFGWETNLKTKPIMIHDLAQFISTGHIKIYDVVTIDECQSFVYHDDGKMGALGGTMDDHVMALAIAVQVFLKRSALRPVPRLQTDVPNRNPVTGY